jgi:crotonobetainyl-CoA:carnitine CoA-transferase CaiB-like acyl-CoA transferase
MTKLLSGVRVLDLTNVIAGPLASYKLALLGAEVIKVEVPKIGDLARKMGADPALGRAQMGVSYLAMNAGKKSITLNLKSERGRKIFEQLLPTADVVLENFRPGTMVRLGLGYERLQEINPRIIYCAVSGFGQKGPLSQRPSYDQIIQGFSGLMDLTGTVENAPNRAGYVVCDTTAAIVAAFAIVSALYRRCQTGHGETIDVSMLDAALTVMAPWQISNYLNAGLTPEPMGNDNPTASPSGTFKTGDGLINIVNNEQKQFEALCGALGAPELLQDERFATRDARVENRSAMRETLERRLSTKSASEWETILSDAGVPAGRIYPLPAILEHDHVAERGLLKWFDQTPQIDRRFAVTRAGFHLSGGIPDVDMPPPVLGEHTTALLKEIGYSESDVERLKAEGAI